jgi:hypothetical protein
MPVPATAAPRRRAPARGDEASIVALVALYGWAIELRRGERERPEREAREALDRWVALGLPFARDAGGARRFDPVEVIGFYKSRGRVLGDPFLALAMAQSRALVLGFHDGTPSAERRRASTRWAARAFASRSSARSTSRAATRGSPLLLRVPLPVDDGTLDGVTVDPSASRGREGRDSPGRLDVRLPHPGTATIPIGVRVSFWSDPSRRGRERRRRSMPPRLALYTRASKAS